MVMSFSCFLRSTQRLPLVSEWVRIVIRWDLRRDRLAKRLVVQEVERQLQSHRICWLER